MESTQQYFFPLARLLSFVPIDKSRLFDILLSAVEATPISFEDYIIETIKRSMSKLDHRERYVLQARYGLMGKKRRTLLNIGKPFGLSRERIRQLQIAARRQEVLFVPFLTALLRDVARRKR